MSQRDLGHLVPLFVSTVRGGKGPRVLITPILTTFSNMSISDPSNDEGSQKDVVPAMDLPDTKAVGDPADSSTETTTGDEIPNKQEECSLAEADVPKKKLCGICNENEWKYKCTRCYLPS